MKQYIRLRPLIISFTCVVIGVSAYLVKIPFMELMELKTVDLRFASRGEVPPSSKIVLAVVDERSIAAEGQWVWPRSKLAALITKLSEADAKVIAFDIGFFEPEDTSRRMIQRIEDIKNEILKFNVQPPEFENYLEDLKKQEDNDRHLKEAIRDSRASVVLGYYFYTEAEKPEHISEKDIAVHQKNIEGSKYKLVRYPAGGIPNLVIKHASAPQSNITELSNATPYSGFFNMFPDDDGVVRWIPAVIKLEKGETASQNINELLLYAPLALVTASVYMESPLSVKISEYGIESVHVGSIPLAADEFGRLMINFRGKEKTFPHISITDILSGKVPKDRLRDRIVIVGATATGAYDMRVTPIDNVFPGVEIHANIVDNILAGDFLYHPSWAALFDIMAMIGSGIFLGLVLPRTGAFLGAGTLFLLFFGHILLCQYLFSEHGLIFNLVYPLFVMLLLYAAITAYRYFTESKQKRFIKSAFSAYLAPSVVEELIKSPEKLELGGEERIITAFFSDVQNFTSISERLAPKELVELLNEFLTEMTDIILRHKGTVDKFEGDAIIAIFGAPAELKNHAEAACLAGADMQKRLAELRENWREKGKPELKMRVGLFTGSAIVGNMGSRQRMDYTMMGDTVNTAARLEGVNKLYGTYSLIGEKTCREGGGRVLTRETDLINVVGKIEPIRIYELIGYREDADASMIESLEYYANGLKAYKNQRWDNAAVFFEKALKITPDDGPSKIMLARCKAFSQTPPKSWNGVFTMETK
jgi:adenylate cyclase